MDKVIDVTLKADVFSNMKDSSLLPATLKYMGLEFDEGNILAIQVNYTLFENANVQYEFRLYGELLFTYHDCLPCGKPRGNVQNVMGLIKHTLSENSQWGVRHAVNAVVDLLDEHGYYYLCHMATKFKLQPSWAVLENDVNKYLV